MSLESIVGTRLFQWFNACDAWGFEIDPPFSHDSLAALAPGQISFRAKREAVFGGEPVQVLLSVSETWKNGPDPFGDRRLEHDGCHLPAGKWHLQVGPDDDGGRMSERLDICDEDETHPRIHRHPFGEINDIRPRAELPHPDGWLHQANAHLGGILDDGFKDWADLADEEE